MGQRDIWRLLIIGAMTVIRWMPQSPRRGDQPLVYNEAWERGLAWQEAVRTGAGMLPTQDAELFKTVLIEGAKKNREDIELPFGE